MVFSLPYIYLIILWDNIIPPNFAAGRGLGSGFFFGNIGYLSTMIAFYLFPLLFFKEKKILELIKDFFSHKGNYFLISLFFVYLFYLINFYDFENQMMIGKGFVHKFSIVLFDNYTLQKIFTYFSFFISWIILLIFTGRNLQVALILLYFFLLSITSSWLLQEYIDPLIMIMAFTFFSSKLLINNRNSIFLFCYLSVLLVSSNIYYFNLIK